MKRRISVTSNEAGQPGAVVLAVSGDIDMLTSDEFAEHLDNALGADNTLVVLDLSGVSFLGSAALSVLSKTANEARTEGVDFRVVASDRMVLRPLEIAGVNQTLAVFDSVDAALSNGG